MRRSLRQALRNTTSQRLALRFIRSIAFFLRILLSPLRYLSNYVFPSDELDGLTAPATSKAVQHFVSHLRSIQAHCSADAWTTTGFSNAKQEAVQNNGLLFIYLHSPLHLKANEFCQKALGDARMQEFLSAQRVTALGVSIHTAQGAQLSQMLNASAFPFIALLRPQSNMSIHMMMRAEGPNLVNLPIERLIQVLNNALQAHQSVMVEEEARRLLREQEAELRRQQDREFQEALLADQEREREMREQEQREIQRQQEEKEKLLEEEQRKDMALASAMSLVRSEPESGGANIRFVLPSGAKVNRRFAADDSIGNLKAFLKVYFHENEVNIERYSLSTSFPRKTYDDESITLHEAGLIPQAVLMVQDLDA